VKTTIQRENHAEARVPRRISGFAIAIPIILVLLGVAFLVMGVGLMAIAGLSLLLSQSVRRLLRIPPGASVQMPARRVILLVGLAAVKIGAGVYLLVELGFCGQNLICMLLQLVNDLTA
jgi:hypothetical protein